MKNTIKKLICSFWLSRLVLIVSANSIFAAQQVRSEAGSAPAAFQPIIDLFRTDLGGSNNGGRLLSSNR